MFIAVVMLFGAFYSLIPIKTHAASTNEEKLSSRLINVVYDDSNSMLKENRLWWCYAKYSLEVFSAMMQDKDSMNIYYMSDGNKAPRLSNLSGDKNQQQKNITTIHNTVTYTSGTPFESLERAYGDLKKTGGYDEKWLVVITDGEKFDKLETASDIDKLIADCSANNIKVIYLAIGEALVPTENQSKGIYVYKADGQVSSGETGILSRVTEICQRIFERPALKNATSSKIVLDVPVSEIIVFAQGSNVSIGNISGAKKTVSTAAMSASDKDKATLQPGYRDKINIDVLNASIVTFTPQNGNYIAEGTYDLPISANEYVVYYKPCLDVVLEMYDSNGNKMTDEYIPIGSYTLQYWLTYPDGHPKYGEKISQNLFDVDYTLYCEADGEKRTLTSNNVDLKEGEVEISVLAEYLKFSSSNASLKYVVEDFTVNDLDVTLEYLQQDYRLSTLEKDNLGILVKVSKNGGPIPAEEWENYKLTCSVDNPDFKVVKNDDGTFMVYPQYNDGKREGTATGDISFDISVSASNGHRTTDIGTVGARINIFDDITATTLGVQIEAQSISCDNLNFADQETDRKVTITWNGRNLTKEQYDALTLSVEIDDENFTADIELDPYVEGQPTTATVHFGIKADEDGNMPEAKKLDGKKTFKVFATIDNEGQVSTGEGEGELKVDDERPWWPDRILDFLPLIIAFAVVLFLFLAYAPLIKKYLPFKSRYTFGGTIQAEIMWYKNGLAIATMLMPFAPVRSSATTSLTTPNVTLNVKAAGKKRIVLENAGDLGANGIRINGMAHNSECKASLLNMQITDLVGSSITTISS